jgi:hypothetical protein
MSQSYDVGTRAWQPDAIEGWVASEVVKKTVDGNKVILEFKLENEQVRRKSRLHPRGHTYTNSMHHGDRTDMAFYQLVQEDRGLPRWTTDRKRSRVTAADEPYHTRSQ